MASKTPFDIRVSPNPPVFDLPVLVGIEEKIFEKHGLRLSYAAGYSDRQQIERAKAAPSSKGGAVRRRQGGRV